MQNFWNSPNNYKFLINDEDYVRWLRKSPFHDRKLHLSNKNNFKQAFFLNFVVICTFFSLWNLLIKMKSSSKWITISRFDIGTHFLSKNLRKFHQSIEKWSMELIKNFVFFFSIVFFCQFVWQILAWMLKIQFDNRFVYWHFLCVWHSVFGEMVAKK